MRTTIIMVAAMLVAGCVQRSPGYYTSDPNHYPYYHAAEEPPTSPNDGWLKGPRYLNGTSASIYDGTHYREGGVRMGNTINYPDGRVEFVRE